jgi:hypothetical protein
VRRRVTKREGMGTIVGHGWELEQRQASVERLFCKLIGARTSQFSCNSLRDAVP